MNKGMVSVVSFFAVFVVSVNIIYFFMNIKGLSAGEVMFTFTSIVIFLIIMLNVVQSSIKLYLSDNKTPETNVTWGDNEFKYPSNILKGGKQ